MEFFTSLVSDIGATRSSNQDSGAILTAETNIGNVVFGIVCDGMGGYSDGEKASAEAVKAFIEWFRHRLPCIIYRFSEPAEIIDNVRNQWAVILGQCNSDIITYGNVNQIKLGTTCTCLLISEKWYCLSHIGDTRIYRISNGSETILTEDHTFTAREVKAGRMTPEEAEKHPKRHALTRGLGLTSNITAQMSSGAVQQGTVYVICSDGFRGTLAPGELAGYYSEHDPELLDQTARCIISDNISRGERDNMTAAAVMIG